MPNLASSGGGRSRKRVVKKAGPSYSEVKPKAKAKAKAPAKKAAPARTQGPSYRASKPRKPSSQAASSVGLDAHRNFATSMNQRARSRGVGPGLNLNPIDYLNTALRGIDLGGAGDILRRSNPQDALFDRIGNRIKNVTR